MNLTSSQKRYAAILGVCLLGLAADMFVLGPPEEAAAQKPYVSPTDSAPAAALPAAGSAQKPGRSSLAARFERVATRQAVDPEDVTNAFAPPPEWLPDETEYVTPAVIDAEGESFRRKHVLSAVMGNATGGQAILDGRSVRVGEQVDGFTLVSVETRAAIFESGNVRIRLLLPGSERDRTP